MILFSNKDRTDSSYNTYDIDDDSGYSNKWKTRIDLAGKMMYEQYEIRTVT